jgi:hypothetical protein
MRLVSGHGGGTVVKNDQNNVRIVVNGVDDAGNTVWKKVESPMKAKFTRRALPGEGPGLW